MNFEGENSLIVIEEKKQVHEFFMCLMCEKFVHFKCYMNHYQIPQTDRQKERNDFQGPLKFICGPCRKDKDQ